MQRTKWKIQIHDRLNKMWVDLLNRYDYDVHEFYTRKRARYYKDVVLLARKRDARVVKVHLKKNLCKKEQGK